MSDLPPPPVPADCDVRGLTWMPLHGRAFGSRFYSLALRDPRAGLAAVKLWWEAWQQCPAGSLPDDDFDLARMADFGSDAKGWQKAKATALHGFVRCADGRLYHPLICREALDAWDRRRRERERKAGQRARKDGPVHGVSRGLSHGTGGGTALGQGAGQGADVRADRTGQDRTDISVPDGTGAGVAKDLFGAKPRSVREALFSDGLAILMRLTGQGEKASRTLIGLLLKDIDNDCARLTAKLREAESAPPADPIAWLKAACRPAGKSKPTSWMDRARGVEIDGEAQWEN